MKPRKRDALGAEGASAAQERGMNSPSVLAAESEVNGDSQLDAFKTDGTSPPDVRAMLMEYLEWGWRVFPVRGKAPLTAHGFKDATTDPAEIDRWLKQFPDCGWAVATGETSGIVVLDIDPRNGGDPDLLDLPATLASRTGGGGLHFFFCANGHAVRSSSNKIAKGIDVKANGGYVVLPPSIHPSGKAYEWQDIDQPIADLPDGLVDTLSAPRGNAPRDDYSVDPADLPDLTARVAKAIGQLSKDRAEDYDQWLGVGMALSELNLRGAGQIGLNLWDDWSKCSTKYEPGGCAQKWLTFKPGEGYTLEDLYRWAKDDKRGSLQLPSGYKAKPSKYAAALSTMGYTFSLNDMNEAVVVNGLTLAKGREHLGDIREASILVQLAEYGYANQGLARLVFMAEADKHRFHPVRECLTALQWDGRDHIGALCRYFTDESGILQLVLTKWLAGAVNKVLADRPGEQNPMVVLDGPQGIGKSRFVWWLGSILPGLYIQSPIDPSDKDFVIRQLSMFVWEVEEVGATFRKSDQEALKAFISREYGTVRKPYGRGDITKPVVCNYIGTVNNEHGFLADTTGNRRFRPTRVSAIDWAYCRDMDVSQVWGQAVALWRDGMTSALSKDEAARVQEVTAEYEQEDPLGYHIFDLFDVDPDDLGSFTATAVILKHLRNTGTPLGGASDQVLFNRIGSILLKAGCRQERRRLTGPKTRGFVGVKVKDYRP